MSPEPPKKAVALRYDRAREDAPRVTASGRGRVAENIIAAARLHGVPLHEDANLVETLSALELDATIPPELYRAVAEVLAFIYRLNGRMPPR
ncbi:MAG: EscU/YscU/HrcU family type III secretion system export apparatus switch protein [Desulfobacterales bacterium]|jgi:flagellar biosynthesis protein|nr:EscU/YscU/HrcU family type III secretion system export apparatus switch protein [Desulfobacterales bacterium]